MFDFIGIGWSVWNFMGSPAGAGILGGLWLISEALASVPSIQANSVFQAVYNGVKKLAGK